MEMKRWVGNPWKMPGQLGTYWACGDTQVDLCWIEYSETVRISWMTGGSIHRMDGPAYIKAQIEREEAEKLRDMSDPVLIDIWLRDHTAQLAWMLNDCKIWEAKGKFTGDFPVVTSDFICSRIELNPEDVLVWLEVARHFGLMDDRLRKLKKAAGLLGI